MRISIDWQDADAGDGRRWSWTLALYAILHPDEDEVLYLGKADGTSVRTRWHANDKQERVWRRIEDELGIFEHDLIVGKFCVPASLRLTRQLVADVESLLIYQLKPWANSQCISTRGTYRHGMVVRCQGQWPLNRKIFRDE